MAVNPPRIRRCGTMEVHHRLLETDPTYRQRLAELQTLSAAYLASDMPLARAGLTEIPVVVHVVYSTAAENISTAQIRSQIRVLNRDFRATNADRKRAPAPWKGLVADARITFKLASVGPDGKSTTGVTRTKTASKSFSQHDEVKASATGGADAWPSDKYLNIWVCTLRDQLLGYAQFPAGPAKTDGVVILNTGFGTTGTAAAPFNGGRSSTHEIGHWLNLHHIWADTLDCSGTDYIDDTPNALAPNYGKPTYPHISCNNGPQGDMFMNFMDYVDDDTMLMFTTQQVARMQAALDNARGNIGT